MWVNAHQITHIFAQDDKRGGSYVFVRNNVLRVREDAKTVATLADRVLFPPIE